MSDIETEEPPPRRLEKLNDDPSGASDNTKPLLKLGSSRRDRILQGEIRRISQSRNDGVAVRIDGQRRRLISARIIVGIHAAAE